VLVVRLRALESSGMRGRCGAPLTFQIARNSIQFAADRTRREDICRDIYIYGLELYHGCQINLFCLLGYTK
jgi:hypothetical protein